MNKDVQIAEHFIPTSLRHIPITDDDRQIFTEWASKGMHKDKVKKSHFDDGFNALVNGKRRAGLHMGLWEEGVVDGSLPYYTLLVEEQPPRFVVDFMKQEMFKGKDAKLIEQVYTYQALAHSA